MEELPSERRDAVISLLRQAVGRSSGPSAGYQLSDALWARGDEDEAAAAFRDAFLADPDASLLGAGLGPDSRRLRDRTQSLLDRGVRFSPVIATRALAAVMLGDAPCARWLVDYDRFCRRTRLLPPQGLDLSDFNAGLREEIKAGVTFYGEQEAGRTRATRLSWRNDDVLDGRSPVCLALADMVRMEVDRYIADLPDDATHPFVAARPESYVLEGWGIVARSDGYLRPHLHPRAWLSAVYYVTEPPLATEALSRSGRLRLGLPDDYGLDPDGGWNELMIKPESGTLFLMPAYFLHGTSPMGTDDERITLAFDIVPSVIAEACSRRPHY